MALQIDVKATNLDLTDEISSYLEEKLQMLNKQFDFEKDAVYVRAELVDNVGYADSEKQFRAEANLDSGTIHLRAEGEGSTLHAAMDEMKSDLLRRVIDIRQKEIDVERKGGVEAKEMLLESDPAPEL
jgi:ribosomal subunit interface protein